METSFALNENICFDFFFYSAQYSYLIAVINVRLNRKSKGKKKEMIKVTSNITNDTKFLLKMN